MSHLQYFSYEGFGDRVRKDTHCSQAVRVGDRILVSGQGGWDPLTEEIAPDLPSQIDQTFANVELALRRAGGRGWDQVYLVRVYLVHFTGEAVGRIVENLRRYCPDHQPVLTGVGVNALHERMGVEIEVEAHVGG